MTDLEGDDDSLVRASLAGDAHAFIVLVRRYDKATRGTAFATVGPAGPVEDALQEGLLKAYKSLRSYQPGTSFRGWLCRIVHNAAIDEVRRNRNVSPIGGEIPTPPPQPNFDNSVISQMELRRIIALLPDKQRVALILVDIEGFDYAATAEMVGVPVGTIASRVNAARGALRTAFLSKEDDAR